MTPSWLL